MNKSKSCWIWPHFELKTTDGERRAYCKLCPNKSYAFHGSTSTLERHLISSHNKSGGRGSTENRDTAAIKRDASGRSVQVPQSRQSQSLSRSDITSYFTSRDSRPCSSSRSVQLTKLACQAVFQDMLPLSCFENKGLKSLLDFVEPNYMPPSHQTVMRHINSMYETECEKLRRSLEILDNRSVSITCDYWTNIQMVSFFTVTAHYVDENSDGSWTLKDCVLATPQSKVSHSGDNIASELTKVITDFGLLEKIWYACHDNAANMKCGVEKCEAVPCHTGCFAHLLHLAVLDSLSETPAAQDCVDIVHKFIAKFKTSERLRAIFSQQRSSIGESDPSIKTRELQLSNVTRWNSIATMLKSFADLQVVLNVCAEVSSDFKEFMPPKSIQGSAEQITKLLSPIVDMTVMWQSGKNSVLSEIYPVLYSVVNLLETIRRGMRPTSVGGKLSLRLLKNIKERFSMDDIEYVTSISIHVVASALDPRQFKRLSFLEKEQRAAVHEHVLKLANEIRPPMAAKVDPIQPTSNSSHVRLLSRLIQQDSQPPPSDCNIEEELLKFLNLKDQPLETDPISWWGKNKEQFSMLSRLARRIYAVQPTSAASERVFSQCTSLYEDNRMSLKPANASQIIFLNKNCQYNC